MSHPPCGNRTNRYAAAKSEIAGRNGMWADITGDQGRSGASPTIGTYRRLSQPGQSPERGEARRQRSSCGRSLNFLTQIRQATRSDTRRWSARNPADRASKRTYLPIWPQRFDNARNTSVNPRLFPILFAIKNSCLRTGRTSDHWPGRCSSDCPGTATTPPRQSLPQYNFLDINNFKS